MLYAPVSAAAEPAQQQNRPCHQRRNFHAAYEYMQKKTAVVANAATACFAETRGDYAVGWTAAAHRCMCCQESWIQRDQMQSVVHPRHLWPVAHHGVLGLLRTAESLRVNT